MQILARRKSCQVGGIVYFAPEIETVQQEGFQRGKVPRSYLSLFVIDKTRPSSLRLIIADRFTATLRFCSQHINMTTMRNMVFESALTLIHTLPELAGPTCCR